MADPAPLLLDNDDVRLRRAWHPVARSVDVGTDDHAVRLLDQRFVVRRAEVGSADAAAGALAAVPEGAAFALAEQGGLVWAALESPIAPIPAFPEWSDPGYHSDVLSRSTHVGAGVLIDNFLDVTHFSYLHRQSFGRSRPVTDDGYRVTARGDFVQLEHDAILQEGRRNFDGGFGERRIATYTYWPPFVCHLQMVFPGDGARAAATLVCQPEAADVTRAYVVVLLPREDAGLAEQVEFSGHVLEEDLELVSRMADPRLCLSIRSEFHTRADRASVEMRRTLTDFLEECGLAQSAAHASEVLA